MTELPPLSQFRLLPSGAWHLGVVVRRSWSWTRGGLVPVATPEVGDSDEITPQKPNTDVVVIGHVYAANGAATSALAEVEVAGRRRVVRATGDRTIRGVHGRHCEWSPPGPFGRVALSASNAYGGFDRGSFERHPDLPRELPSLLQSSVEELSCFSYPRNHIGRGFCLEAEAPSLVGTLAPNLDDPEDPVEPERLIRRSEEDWPDAPIPATLGWLAGHRFPRVRFFGEMPSFSAPARPWREVLWGALEAHECTEAPLASAAQLLTRPVDLQVDARALSGGALELSRGRLLGGEPVLLRGLTAAHRDVRFPLPTTHPAVRLTPPGCPAFDLPTQMTTVLLEPDAERLTISYAARLEVAGQYPEDELRQVRVDIDGDRFSS